MKVDTRLPFADVDVADAAREAVAAGYDGAWAAETKHDPLLSLATATIAAPELTLGTGILVAFARSPMTTAVAANDLQTLTRGKFLLGLGSQVKPHIERRFSMPWSHPAARMREFVLATRAIWRSWAGEGKLEFEGEFYRHTLMTPYFDPGPNPYGNPEVILAGVGTAMTEIAGEVADGFLCHAFTTERFVREVTKPALAAGATKAGRDPDTIGLVGGPFVVTGRDENELAAAVERARDQIAFYASTAAYRPVLDLHGWGELQGELNTLAKQERWPEMGALVDDEILDAFAVVGEPDRIAAETLRRYGDLFTRVTFHAPWSTDADLWRPIAAGIRSA